MTTFIMMIGLPGSGKDYYCEHNFLYPIISSDNIREELFGDMNDQTHNTEVFNEVHKRIHKLLRRGESCVYNATNLSRKRRRNFLKTLPKDIKKVAVLIATEYDLVLEQNRTRDRHVPEEVIDRMFKKLTVPRKDEGWDEIIYYPHPNNKHDIGYYFNNCKDLDQDNPHHKLPLDEHLKKAAQYIAEHKYQGSLVTHTSAVIAATAALYHDIGKPIVKSRIKWNGESDNCSHYYNHADVGAYLIACTLRDNDSEVVTRIFRTALILTQWHMEKFNKDFAIESFINTYGEHMGKMLEVLFEADEYAH